MNAVGDHSLSLKKIFDNFSDYQGNCLEWSLNGLWFVILVTNTSKENYNC